MRIFSYKHVFVFAIILFLFLAGCTTEKFKKPDIKDDFCGAHINFQYCRCAFHNEYCENIGMSRSGAKTYVNLEYDKWADGQLKAWLAACAIAGGIPGDDDCTYEKYGVIEKDGHLYLNSKPGEVLIITTDDLPEWAKGQIATLGANIAVVGPPDSIAEGDYNVLLDGFPIARVNDSTSHGGYIVEGSKNIFVNGKPAALIGGYAVDPTVNPGPVPRVGGPITNNINVESPK